MYTHTSCAVHNLDTLRGYLYCDWEPRENVILWILKIHSIFRCIEYFIYLFPLFLWSVMIVGIFCVVGLCTCTQKNLMACCICLLGVGRCIYNVTFVYTLSLHVSQCSTVVRTQNLIVILVLHVYRNSFSFLVTHPLFYTCV